jgi:hypothetical protein
MTEKSEAEVGTVLGGLVEQKGGKLEYERPLKQSGIEKVKKIIKPLNIFCYTKILGAFESILMKSKSSTLCSIYKQQSNQPLVWNVFYTCTANKCCKKEVDWFVAKACSKTLKTLANNP